MNGGAPGSLSSGGAKDPVGAGAFDQAAGKPAGDADAALADFMWTSGFGETPDDPAAKAGPAMFTPESSAAVAPSAPVAPPAAPTAPAEPTLAPNGFALPTDLTTAAFAAPASGGGPRFQPPPDAAGDESFAPSGAGSLFGPATAAWTAEASGAPSGPGTFDPVPEGPVGGGSLFAPVESGTPSSFGDAADVDATAVPPLPVTNPPSASPDPVYDTRPVAPSVDVPPSVVQQVPPMPSGSGDSIFVVAAPPSRPGAQEFVPSHVVPDAPAASSSSDQAPVGQLPPVLPADPGSTGRRKKEKAPKAPKPPKAKKVKAEKGSPPPGSTKHGKGPKGAPKSKLPVLLGVLGVVVLAGGLFVFLSGGDEGTTPADVAGTTVEKVSTTVPAASAPASTAAPASIVPRASTTVVEQSATTGVGAPTSAVPSVDPAVVAQMQAAFDTEVTRACDIIKADPGKLTESVINFDASWLQIPKTYEELQRAVNDCSFQARDEALKRVAAAEAGNGG